MLLLNKTICEALHVVARVLVPDRRQRSGSICVLTASCYM